MRLLLLLLTGAHARTHAGNVSVVQPTVEPEPSDPQDGSDGTVNTGFASVAVAAEDDMSRLIRDNILLQLVPQRATPHVDLEVTSLHHTLQPNGTWPAINYTDGAKDWWVAAEHLRNCLLMASALSSPLSQHHAEPALRSAADRAFEWWLATNLVNHWWWSAIGVPRMLCKYLLLLPSPRLYTLALPLLDVTPLDVARSYTGCNRVWGASIHILRGAIELNATRLRAAYSVAHSTLHLAPQHSDGIQSDGSFHQHGPQLYVCDVCVACQLPLCVVTCVCAVNGKGCLGPLASCCRMQRTSGAAPVLCLWRGSSKRSAFL